MNSLDDLLRETLAERAHDVDGLTLTATPPPGRSGRRRVAVGTVVAVAAALLVAVVLVAPWRGATDRNATPPAVPTPPAGMQWVSFHGITLTVPDTWQTTTFSCSLGAGRPGLVRIDVDRLPCPSAGPSVPTVALAALVDPLPRGDRVTLGGHVAYRLDSPQTVDRVFVQLPDAGVQLTAFLPSGDASLIQDILDSIEYTPVDHLGCVAHLSSLESTGAVPAPDVSDGVVCQYTAEEFGLALIGSRQLTAAELATVTGPASPAPGPSSGLGADRGALVYRLSFTDGSTRDLAFPVDQSETQLPRAYPS